ncbi:MAG: PIN domain-containing protein [Pseudanabaena sp. CAN_BIN31]|nr:PIN domain-containing protein [Pseudanabaena sp. CAN_BIN31]
MAIQPSFPVVIDTNVVFEGLTKQGGAAGLVIDAWLAGLLEVCISNALAYEYEDVLSRKISKPRWQKLQPILDNLFHQSRFTIIYYSWRPTSPDAGDDLVIDCAMNAAATVITSNLRDFQTAKKSLGLQVMTPTQLVVKLASIGNEP